MTGRFMRAGCAGAVFVGLVFAEIPAHKAQERIGREVLEELVTMPTYSLFDHITCRVEGSKVTLLGAVTRPALKSRAVKAAERVEGVQVVDNQIEVLPLSPDDDRIRAAAYHMIYSRPQLEHYQKVAVPPIHIIVKNSNITLEGAVANESEKTIAGMAARETPGSFAMTNRLQVDDALRIE